MYDIELSRRTVSAIKLKRTDTTLDLSQKAKRAVEKKIWPHLLRKFIERAKALNLSVL